MSLAVTVARIPLGIGASIGVKEILTDLSEIELRICSISGVC